MTPDENYADPDPDAQEDLAEELLDVLRKAPPGTSITTALIVEALHRQGLALVELADRPVGDYLEVR